MMADNQRLAANMELLETLAYNMHLVTAELAGLRLQDKREVASEYRSIFDAEQDVSVRIVCYRNAIKRAILEIASRKGKLSLCEELSAKYLPPDPVPKPLDDDTESA